MKNLDKEIEEILNWCLEHNHVGHELNEDFECELFEKKDKCNCGWDKYEKDLNKKFKSLIKRTALSCVPEEAKGQDNYAQGYMQAKEQMINNVKEL